MKFHFKPNNEFIKENRLAFQNAAPNAALESTAPQNEVENEAAKLVTEFDNIKLTEADYKEFADHPAIAKKKSALKALKLAKVKGFSIPKVFPVNMDWRAFYVGSALQKKFGKSEKVNNAINKATNEQVIYDPNFTEKAVAKAEDEGEGLFARAKRRAKEIFGLGEEGPKSPLEKAMESPNALANYVVDRWKNEVDSETDSNAQIASTKKLIHDLGLKEDEIFTPAILAGKREVLEQVLGVVLRKQGDDLPGAWPLAQKAAADYKRKTTVVATRR